MKKIIFHHPLPLNPNAKSASGIRPIKMLNAFKQLGYDVAIVDGYGYERKQKIEEVKKRILNGEKFDFIYSESSTQPTLLTEKNHLPKYPFLDFGFFNFCKKRGIKIGLFYRDIYWRFGDYGKNLSFFKKNIAKSFYWYDLYKYNKLIDILYLPSIKMGKYVPIVNNNKFNTLPPGCDDIEMNMSNKNKKSVINLLYIGGLGSHYKMHKLFNVLSKIDNVKFTLCTREEEWQNAKQEYKASKNIQIVHKSGEELLSLYEESDICMLFVEPQEYREFAAPVKLYEYIGKEKPIIASTGTLAGKFVEENNIGWAVKYDEDAVLMLLKELSENKALIMQKKENIKKIREKHTWKARAKQVVRDLK